MFKLTKGSGRRNARPTGQTSRISGLTGLRGSMPPHPIRPPFLPDTPQEQTFDSSTSRVDEPGESKRGWSGKGIGA